MLTGSPRSFLTFRTDFHSGPISRPRLQHLPGPLPASGLAFPDPSSCADRVSRGPPGWGSERYRQVEGRSSHASPPRTLGRHVSPPPPGLRPLATTWAGRLFRPVGHARCVSTPPLRQVRSEGPPRPPQTFPVGTAADRGGALRSRCLFLSTSQPSRGAAHTCGHSGLERRPQPLPCWRRPETLPAARPGRGGRREAGLPGGAAPARALSSAGGAGWRMRRREALR